MKSPQKRLDPASLRSRVKRLLGKVRRARGPKAKPPLGTIRLGDLERTTPFSRDFGFDRGGPVDRVYIERFLEEHSPSIRGRTLEIGDDSYTRRFGGDRTVRRDVFHVDGTRENAAFVGDLADAPDVPSDTFDCIVLTQTLQFVWDVKGALATCHRILAPGGTLLLTAPGLSQLDRGEWSESWYWAFTDRWMRRLLAEAFPGGDVAVTSYGNVYAATTFLWGMGAPEVRPELLEARDPCYPVIVAAAARKRS